MILKQCCYVIKKSQWMCTKNENKTFARLDRLARPPKMYPHLYISQLLLIYTNKLATSMLIW